MNDIKKLLEDVKNGSVSVDDALIEIKKQPFVDIGYAKVDLHRNVRQGAPEVIYGAGKTTEQIKGILDTMTGNGIKTIIITRQMRRNIDKHRYKIFRRSTYRNSGRDARKERHR